MRDRRVDSGSRVHWNFEVLRGTKSTSWSRKGLALDPTRSLCSGSRDCHCEDCWLPNNVRDGRMGRGSESVASVDAAAADALAVE